jgi:hypothetical protein
MRRKANRCFKCYLARHLYRLLEHGPPGDSTNIEASGPSKVACLYWRCGSARIASPAGLVNRVDTDWR